MTAASAGPALPTRAEPGANAPPRRATPMTRKTIHLVMAVSGYESSTVVRGYYCLSDAVHLRDRMAAHKAKEPQCPTTDAADDVWDKYTLRLSRWKARMPGGADFADDDSFTVSDIEVWGSP